MCIGIFLPPHVVPICIVTYILPIPLPAAYLLKWLLKQGTQQQPLRLCTQTFEKLMLAVPGKCQCFKSNFFMLTLPLKLLYVDIIPAASFSRSFFSLTERKYWNVFFSIFSNGWISFNREIKCLAILASRVKEGVGHHAHGSSLHRQLHEFSTKVKEWDKHMKLWHRFDLVHKGASQKPWFLE